MRKRQLWKVVGLSSLLLVMIWLGRYVINVSNTNYNGTIRVDYPVTENIVQIDVMLQRLSPQLQRYPNATRFELHQPFRDSSNATYGDVDLTYDRSKRVLTDHFYSTTHHTGIYKNVVDAAIHAAAKVPAMRVQSTLIQHGCAYKHRAV